MNDMLGESTLGQRVSVRRQADGGLRDVVGHLVDCSEEILSVLRGSGEVARIERDTIVAAKVVPGPVPVRRGWAVPEVSPEDMQRICWAGWPAREVELLGSWALRAHGGITGRANSTMAVADPGCPVVEALSRVEEFYRSRGLPPLLQLPLADPANAVMAEHGWVRRHVTVVQVAPIAPVVAGIQARPDLRAVVEPTPSVDWQSLMHDLDLVDPRAHLQILTGPPVVGFATLYDDDLPVGIGRVSIEGEWAGITSVDVAPESRRGRVGSAVMAALLGWAAQQGAVWTYLQVRAANDAALRLYARLGYVTHHPYTYRALDDLAG